MTVIEQEVVWTDDRPTAPSTPSEPVASARQHRFLSRAAWREFALLAVVNELYTATRRISTGGAGGKVASDGFRAYGLRAPRMPCRFRCVVRPGSVALRHRLGGTLA
jgi:hypothetical protein